MTAREKLAMEHPDKIDEQFCGGCGGCPDHYGYLPEPSLCEIKRYPAEATCANCWDREIPETDNINQLKKDLEEGWITVNDAREKMGLPKLKDSAPHILDSGDRTEFESGAVRDMRKGKGRCDLLPLDVVADIMTDAVFQSVYKFQETNELVYLYNALEFFRSNRDWDCPTMLLETAIHFEDGAVKYGDDNWRRGIPVKVFLDSALRHYIKFLRGDKDEPHDRAVCWNLMCAIWTAKHKPELNDYRKET